MKALILFIMGLILASPLFSQVHLSPLDGQEGVPGPIPKSFVIKWESVPGAMSYEYVLTDNANCFEGCAGDTRQRQVESTIALEYDLREGRDYYWITRMYLPNGDTTGWTKVSHFKAITPRGTQTVTIYPNPGTAQQANLRIDWGNDSRVTGIKVEGIALSGRKAFPVLQLRKINSFDRYADIPLPDNVASGVYFLTFLLQDAQGGTLEKITQKWVVRFE